jgi:hypothetical protein
LPSPDPKDVFINVPFDRAYEPLLVTLVSTLAFLGQEPHCVLEIRESGQGRLARIIDLMLSCRTSIHDLSRMSRPPRFNMPYELGLASAIKTLYPNDYEVLVLDSRPYRIDRTLSDYKGRDVLIHNGTCDGMVTCLLDTFQGETYDAVSVRAAAKELRKIARVIKLQLKITSLFRPSAFRRLLAAAAQIATERRLINPT